MTRRPLRLDGLAPRTVNLDDNTVRMANALGDSLSDGLRKSVVAAYRLYQRAPDPVPGEACPCCRRVVP
jgi:hypothetical protein